jgi:hypothetical protein
MADDVGTVLGALAKDQLDDERQAAGSLAQRAAIVISTSGTLVTLLLGAAALVTRTQSFTVPHSVLIEAAIAVILLIVAALAALRINGTWSQAAIPVEKLRSEKYKRRWDKIDGEVAQDIHDERVNLIAVLRSTNKLRARWLMSALSLESVAVACLATGTLQILLR